ncbi:MAG: HU family DNA-binding protein [Candidatus Omnitrophica bacterium]|nr:HU family DNA-binding protein [Candidatus Omnitrophota bacterium]MCK5288894.1 HU family DNA-binding protein [Candidatus Omnitrophota bacterium]MCK5392742.1 HU family DNA-binding protein [Candidatus Omnitrophota bacterium]
MNKAELIEELAKVLCTKKEAGIAVNGVLDAIKATLKKKKEVAIAGFGTFKVVKRKARLGKNPQTGEQIKIPAKKAPVFRPGKALKELVN